MKTIHVKLTIALVMTCGASGCSTGTNETSTSGTLSSGTTAVTASSGSSTGGTTGSACAAEYYHCFNQDVQSNCCAGLVCSSSNLCASPAGTTGGGTTGGATTSGGSSSGGPMAGTSTGGAPCASACCQTTDCPDDYKSCQGGVCRANLCGPGTGNGTALYAPCDAAGIDDGLCMPVLGSSANSAAACVQGGTCPASGCTYSRYPDGGAGSICPAGQLCDPSTDSCADVCAFSAPSAPDGGPGCPTGQACAALFGATGVCQ
jgi:hypothetical protein